MGSVVHLLSLTVPLALAAAVSPVPLLVQVTTLAGARPRARGLAFSAGTAVPLLAIAGGALGAGISLPSSWKHTARPALDLALSGALIAVAAFTWLRKQREKPPRAAGLGLGPSFGLGLALMATNGFTLVLWASAMSSIADEHANAAAEVATSAIDLAITMAVVLVPLAFFIVAPEAAQRALPPFGAWMRRHRRAVMSGLCAVFAVYLAVKGVRAL
jgi:threonine/homoserine/homoserine lactone efflux protein